VLIRPMLATLGPLPPPPGRNDQWGFELKWDGVRAITYLSGGTLRLLSRTDKDMTSRYPELAALASAVDGPMILDGEIIALDDRGLPSFTTLQQRMQIAHPPAALVAAVPVTHLATKT
jgi:bifunctional non-homologous end joining protein LigD